MCRQRCLILTLQCLPNQQGLAIACFMLRIFFLSLILWPFAKGLIYADEPRVLSATIKQASNGTFTISAEVEHGDDGWDHYADAWEVLTPEGEVIATRKLAHPHVNEQPFIRSKSGIKIPADITEVIVRAHDKVHGAGEKTVTLTVPGRDKAVEAGHAQGS